MCGIIGTASTKQLSNRSWLAVGRDTLRHRGPDDAGEWWSADGRIGLGHRRLKIVDLSVAGHQPMSARNGDVWIVFNGEIYNFIELREELRAKGHSFRSQSDTEVILAAYLEWGTACLSRLNGMFAFALYDTRSQQLLLARDRAGEKPLFYSLIDGVLSFASELKGLMANPSFPRKIDPTALDCYLAMGYVPGELCIFQAVKKLPPGHTLTFNLELGKIQVHRYWELPVLSHAAATGEADEEELLQELEALLEDAVRRHQNIFFCAHEALQHLCVVSQTLVLRNLDRRPQAKLRAADLAVRGAQHDVTAERVLFEHEIEGGIQLVRRHTPGDEGTLGQFVGQESLPHAPDHTGLEHGPYAFEHRVQRQAALFGNGLERMTSESADAILTDGEDARIDFIAVLDRD